MSSKNCLKTYKNVLLTYSIYNVSDQGEPIVIIHVNTTIQSSIWRLKITLRGLCVCF